MKRGDIYIAIVQPRSGAEISGERPVLIISHDSFVRVPGWRSITVVPLSSSARQARRGPTVVALPDGAGGLRGAGVAVCHQLTTLDRDKLTRRVGTLPPELVARVEQAIRAALDLS
ncbi:MAG: type II toxin-antitoxin system PemK/MazF family toxin [Pseudomonadota bacterium]